MRAIPFALFCIACVGTLFLWPKSIATELEQKREGGHLTVESIGRAEVHWQLPVGRTTGLLLVFHGCNHQGGDFFECDNCLGLPEERAIVQAALKHNLVVAAVSAGYGHNKCWSHDDSEPVVRIVDELRARLKLEGLPIYGIGASRYRPRNSPNDAPKLRTTNLTPFPARPFATTLPGVVVPSLATSPRTLKWRQYRCR